MALVSGAQGYNVLNVHLADGSKVDIKLGTELRITFTDTHLVATGKDATVEVAKADIKKMEHVFDAEAGIDAAVADASGFVREGDTLSFTDLPAGSRINVYTVGGAQVRSVAAEGQCSVDLGDLAAGVYIVTVNNMSYKITVK